MKRRAFALAALVLVTCASCQGTGYSAQRGVACAIAVATALHNIADSVMDCRAAARGGTDQEVRQCIDSTISTASTAPAAVPACMPDQQLGPATPAAPVTP